MNGVQLNCRRAKEGRGLLSRRDERSGGSQGPVHGLNTSVTPMGRGAPKPPEGVSFGELASVRQTPRTGQQSAQNSSAWEVAWQEVDQRTTAGLGLWSVCSFRQSGESGGSVSAVPRLQGLPRRASQCHLTSLQVPRHKKSHHAQARDSGLKATEGLQTDRVTGRVRVSGQRTRSGQHSIPFHSIPFHSIPFHSIPFHSIPFHSIPFHSIPFHSIPFHSIPFHSIPFHSIPFHSIPFHSGAVQCSAVQCSAVQCSALQCSAVR